MLSYHFSMGTIFWRLFPMEVSCFLFVVESNWPRNILGIALCYFAVCSYTFVFKIKGQRLVLIINTSKTCILQLFKSQNNKEQVKRIAEKEVREDANYFNFFFRLVSIIHISYIQRSFKSSKLNLNTVHLWTQCTGRNGSWGHCATAAAQRQPV